jgi:hypothetical protein
MKHREHTIRFAAGNCGYSSLKLTCVGSRRTATEDNVSYAFPAPPTCSYSWSISRREYSVM